ncbi:MAG: prepilin peptidase [Anaeromicrobium sp.]|jgi:leader peptidase (prepilin peptidase)/N-methyltransferase|uniref:prepilin peptidase n=1 Tax=Anaeromicrobium sp. TaxID=1929132 RepID=UPI0025E36B64|nr:A24 family peptidase [Anaeromicrobium sp.]MCT4595685.1 prepilin peptidase [Anaeromicrobium sp.]
MGIQVFVLGLLIGSFLNVCIYRIPRDESIVVPGSHCIVCMNKLRAIDLIPVLSYLFLGRKCRFCKTKIGLRYTIVELLTGLVFLLLFNKYGYGIDFTIYIILMSILIVIGFIDYDHMIIPDQLVFVATMIGVLVVLYNKKFPMYIYGTDSWYSPFLGVIIGSGSLLIISLVGMAIYRGQEVMGMGDVKIFIPIGLFLGAKMTAVTLFLSILVGAIISILLIVWGYKSIKSHIPFGPFIVIGTFVSLVWGWDLYDLWYEFVFAM